MLIIALVLAVIGLAALVTAVVTSNELIAWVCIAASLIGVILLIVDAVRDRSRRDRGDSAAAPADSAETQQFDADYPDEPESDAELRAADHDHGADHDTRVDEHDDSRAVPFDERHEDEPTTRSGQQPGTTA